MVGVLFLFLSLLYTSQPAYAIPSPDLVVGSISSISQLITLLSASLGGAALAGGRLAFGGARPRSGSPLPLWLLASAGMLLLVALGLNGYQYLVGKDAETARLSATLSRPSHDPGAALLDPTLKEISYRDQLVNPLGMTTDALADLLDEVDKGKTTDVLFFDIREDGEAAMGMAPHFNHIRFPDFSPTAPEIQGKRIVLMCDNGNRSHEVAEILSSKGIPVSFVRGGIEKWIVEGKAVSGGFARTPENLRAIPPFRNDKVLLDTPDVRNLVATQNAAFVDVRYPGDFEHGHLPGAINIPIRGLPSGQLHEAIENVPKRPIVLACYDKRSCFMSEVLGLELTKAGYDVRGRYTLPWEYFVAAEDPPHIVKWRQLSDTSWRAWAAGWLSDWLEWASNRIGGLSAAILLLALLSRALVLPFTVATERDQIKLRGLSTTIEAIAQRCAMDRKRKSRALKALYRKHGMRPGRNLLALLFLPLFLISLEAIARTAERLPSSFLWIPDLSGKDPLYVLPLAFGVLVALYLQWVVARTRRQSVVVWGVGMPACVAMALALSAGGTLYMVLSVALMLIQRAVIVLPFSALYRAAFRNKGLLKLSNADHQDCGNKATRLARLSRVGVAVPPGVVLTPSFCHAHLAEGSVAHQRSLARIVRRLPGTRFAVRSSGAHEDGADDSFAGIFETVLNVGKQDIPAAVDRVWRSFQSERAQSYSDARGAGSIIIQHMVDAQFAGVAFTQDPAHAGLMLVELVKGTGEALVSGVAIPDVFRLGRFTGTLVGEQMPPIDLAPLFAMARQCEALFAKPQDIEWAYRGGKFYILQSRDITRTVAENLAGDSRTGRLELERDRLLAYLASQDGHGEPCLEQNELSELLPRPTPSSLSLMNALWQSGGSVDLACRGLGLDYKVDEDSRPYVVAALGRLYVNRAEAQWRAPRVQAFARRRLQRAARQVDDMYRATFSEFASELVLLDAVDFNRMPAAALVAEFKRRLDHFVTETHVTVETINVVADFHVQLAHRMLEERGVSPARYLHSTSVGLLQQVAAISDPEARASRFLSAFGHRAPLDYELSQPRYAEDATSARKYVDRLTVAAAAEIRENGQDEKIELVETACHLQDLKEEAKHESLREFALLRKIMLALDRRFDLDGLIFYLTVDEVVMLCDENLEMLHGKARERKQDEKLFASVPPLPTRLALADLETASFERGNVLSPQRGAMKGSLVSGSGNVVGRAYVVATEDAECGAALEGFEEGDIIVSRFIHPNWLPYFGRAGGFVSELGGWLSHTAILAREYSRPMVVGVRSTANIEFGARLQIHPDGTITTLNLDSALWAAAVGELGLAAKIKVRSAS